MGMPLRCSPTMLSDAAHSLCAFFVRLFLWHPGKRCRRKPAGMIENEDADTTARREAYEELGVDLPSLEFVARVWSSPGVSTERQSLFLAPYRSADRISDGGGVEGGHEGITVVERLLAELAADVDQGRIADGKLLTLVLPLRLRRPDLFV